jgi:hypothetical protein
LKIKYRKTGHLKIQLNLAKNKIFKKRFDNSINDEIVIASNFDVCFNIFKNILKNIIPFKKEFLLLIK